MVLLTSSQVSVLISSAIAAIRVCVLRHSVQTLFPLKIVVSCTTALFLSGYVIQQRTLSQLREAIKPELRPSPKASYYVPEHLKDAAGNGQNAPLYGANGKQEQIVIEVNPTVPEKHRQQQQQGKKPKAGLQPARWTSGMWQKMMGPSEKEEKGGISREDLEKMDERERNINGWNVKDQANPDPEASNQKPISRAERRRLIKEELRRLSESEERVYYQRRLW
ncbi:hypothetical protein CORC01_01118 [Colletotrichum orchidophilum]|uniref:Uncharacterized protein n=1 Tax=Colletotrichum orchidophilum TaxID=1209926 RepID=A0A1G4BPL7_9PEZI|nr:uncharacterized protein CORC01_01118 [Colletotrichum orchidophilum]OHF03399.1 hypothetical protein CORC01_01118 [Colletotrichum orchidophilum]